MIDTNVKTSIIMQKINIFILFIYYLFILFSHPKMEPDNIETTIETTKINLREINGEKHQGFKDAHNILSYELRLFLTQLG